MRKCSVRKRRQTLASCCMLSSCRETTKGQSSAVMIQISWYCWCITGVRMLWPRKCTCMLGTQENASQENDSYPSTISVPNLEKQYANAYRPRMLYQVATPLVLYIQTWKANSFFGSHQECGGSTETGNIPGRPYVLRYSTAIRPPHAR